ncbi:molecular chaperone [Salmonella enterica]|nr:molecular chaperone [Salmonella enterica]EDZ3573664.1 fimbria/pilus periplasmic chaperone [Salmonella enterica]ELW2864817.1 molecular chaperone [Salmonella enterica]
MHILPCTLLCALISLTSLSHAAGVQIGRTRIIYDANKKEVSLPLVNKDSSIPWLIQSWTDTGDGKTRGPFIVTPPLFRLDAQKEQSLRIAWNGTAIAPDKESLFYMNVRTIPGTAKEDDDKNILRLIYKTRIKLFWRPKGLAGTASETCGKLRFTRHEDQLTVINDGAFYSVFDSLSLGGHTLKNADMIAPKSTIQLSVPHTATGSTVNWRCITDYGNASKQHTTTLTGNKSG